MKKSDQPFDLPIQTLGFFIHRAYYTMVKMLNKEMKMRGLNLQHSDFAILLVLNEVGSASQTQLSSLQGKERSGVSRSLVALEKEGYIERLPLDGKTNLVKLSQKGKDLMPELQEIGKSITNNAFKGFDSRSRYSTINKLTKIYQNGKAFLEKD